MVGEYGPWETACQVYLFVDSFIMLCTVAEGIRSGKQVFCETVFGVFFNKEYGSVWTAIDKFRLSKNILAIAVRRDVNKHVNSISLL